MNKITLEKTHALLEKLAEYVMTEVPTQREMDKRFDDIDKRFERIEKQLDQLRETKADKKDIIDLKRQLNVLTMGMDKLVGEVQINRTEQKAFDAALHRLESRIDDLEQKQTGYRINDKEE
jgi:chromosome segregation ATPase